MPVSESINAISQIILGKEREIKLAVACLLARGHLLIEDLPGVGKTTLALTLAKVFGLNFNRLQFTSDLLPADVTGISIYSTTNNRFDFHPGPVFTQVLLADEINRATPKTQSALLEAMEEQRVSIDGHTHDLPTPFFVIATQNPLTQLGTYPLPESQLDRFLMRIELGYPDASAEKQLLSGQDPRQRISTITQTITPDQLIELQAETEQVHCSESIIEYIYKLVNASRHRSELSEGLSPRAGIAIKKAAQAWALIDNRDFVLPEDVQAIFDAVSLHRLQLQYDQTEQDLAIIAGDIIHSVAV